MRRHFGYLFFLVVLILTSKSRADAGDPTFNNPLVLQRADPFVMLHSDGFYYFTATVPEYDRLVLRRAKSLNELGAAEEKVLWRKHEHGAMGSHIWAPELHRMDGKWYIYFAAGGAEKIWDIRIYAVENDSPNPMEGEWKECGQVKTAWESFALDATTFEHGGANYLVWAQKDSAIKGNTNLYIAKMDTPTSITGKPVMLSKPDLPWERIGFWVNEGPAVLERNGKIFITYSASATDYHYCMGMLTADARSDLLNAASWTKSQEPVLKTDEAVKVFGPGHNSFTTTLDGKTVLMVYHARNYKEIKGDPLHDPNRNARAQVVHWKGDGTPDFGNPAGDTSPAEAR
jgi:GH43 family beta-xylosidase